MSADTIFALSSGSPPAAIAVIRVSGPAAHRAGECLAGGLPPARQAAVRELYDAKGELLDQALVLRFDGPSSATGENLVEFHCHGGRAVVNAILRVLREELQLRDALPGEFSRRSFENGRMDLTEAEGLADLLEAETESQRRAALVMAEGGLSRQIGEWQSRLLAASAAAELAIDYVGEDREFGQDSFCRDCGALAKEMELWLSRPRAERLRDGVLVVIAGPVNAGKSSLLNAIAGSERAIVTDIPGTTRDYIEVPVALAGTPLRLTDTAGLRESDELVERAGIGRSRRLIEQADVLVWLGAPEDCPAHSRAIQIHAQCDRPDRGTAPAGSMAISAATGEGLAQLVDAIVSEARSILPSEGEVALNARQAGCIAEAAEALRESSETEDVVIVAELLRSARNAFDRLTGRAGVEDLLDALFGRFCLGK